jgi:hypothetical protein
MEKWLGTIRVGRATDGLLITYSKTRYIWICQSMQQKDECLSNPILSNHEIFMLSYIS